MIGCSIDCHKHANSHSRFSPTQPRFDRYRGRVPAPKARHCWTLSSLESLSSQTDRGPQASYLRPREPSGRAPTALSESSAHTCIRGPLSLVRVRHSAPIGSESIFGQERWWCRASRFVAISCFTRVNCCEHKPARTEPIKAIERTYLMVCTEFVWSAESHRFAPNHIRDMVVLLTCIRSLMPVFFLPNELLFQIFQYL